MALLRLVSMALRLGNGVREEFVIYAILIALIFIWCLFWLWHLTKISEPPPTSLLSKSYKNGYKQIEERAYKFLWFGPKKLR